MGLLLLGVCGACGGGETSEEAPPDTLALSAAPDSMTVDRVLRTDPRFSTLVAALDSTGLDSTLASGGPFTLFAPPDSAFAALPDGTVPLLLTERLDRLRAILNHHVVEGRVTRGTLTDTSVLTTLGGDSLRVQEEGGALVVGTARLLDGDVKAANGLIHVVDQVLRPPAPDGG